MSSPAKPATSDSPQSPTPRSTRPRCRHVSRSGRPCRYRAFSIEQPFCKNHLPPDCPEALYAALQRMARNFDTPEGVTNVLYTIFFALVEGRISERKAGLLTYITQTILHSHRATAFLHKLEAEAAAKQWPMCPTKLTWNLPRAADDAPSSQANTSEPSANPPEAPAAESSPNEAALSAVPKSAPAKPEDPPAPSPAPKPSHKKEAPPPSFDLNHFYPRDPTFPPRKNSTSATPASTAFTASVLHGPLAVVHSSKTPTGRS
jgi:hypothetical protein